MFESVDLAKVSQNAIEALEVNAQAKGVMLKYEGDESCYIKGNSSLLDELVYNLCDNAIRYNKPDGEVTVKVLKVPTGALLTVSDTGIGIPEKYQQRIFKAPEQLSVDAEKIHLCILLPLRLSDFDIY